MDLTMATKRQIIERQKNPYRRACKKEKSDILNALVTTTGLTKDHVSRVLRDQYQYEKGPVKPGRGRKPIYGMTHKELLKEAWILLHFPSSRRLAAALPDVIDNLERHGYWQLETPFKQQMLQMSHGTMDRLLRINRKRLNPFGRSTTKPGTLLKSQIPIRRGTDWDDACVGFMEIDLVAHCGHSTKGEFALTLNATDIKTGWTECQAVRNKARVHTLEAMKRIEQRLPFPLRGIDSDNGSEFINMHFLNYCQEKDLCFTRSRPNRSNDGCYVEQKNWSVVRHLIGYDRFEGQKAVDVLNQYYELLSILNNFFLPSQKLIQRVRDGSKVIRKHDIAASPYRRLLIEDTLCSDQKEELHEFFESLDLISIQKEMGKRLAQLQSLSLGY
jgi:hypothetical protein